MFKCSFDTSRLRRDKQPAAEVSCSINVEQLLTLYHEIFRAPAPPPKTEVPKNDTVVVVKAAVADGCDKNVFHQLKGVCHPSVTDVQ